jgi:fructose-specific phosphotransferase system IIA component
MKQGKPDLPDGMVGSTDLKVSSFLSPKRLAILNATSKSDALRQTLELFRECPYINDFPAFCAEIKQREEVLSTGIGFGVGIPHVRSKQVRESVSALAVLNKPVDYGSSDGIPVNIIIMIGMPDGEQELYMKYLSRISLHFQSADFRRKIGSCTTVDELTKAISLV